MRTNEQFEGQASDILLKTMLPLSETADPNLGFDLSKVDGKGIYRFRIHQINPLSLTIEDYEDVIQDPFHYSDLIQLTRANITDKLPGKIVYGGISDETHEFETSENTEAVDKINTFIEKFKRDLQENTQQEQPRE
ncbi:MAG: hypothetical protein M1450_04535 [Patescibacteria group bacterium]|nr:hypothetical protein [Actinomycetota bacterium]MCL5970737.1 hypothetical protein [Patescibacteria group bacterium]